MSARGVRIYQHGAPSVMVCEDLDIGALGPHEVRLRQRAIGLNFVDTMFRDGTFLLDLPAVLGIEGTGVVEAVGASVGGYRVGDRVAYFYAPGSYASERVAPEQALVHLPDDITEEQSATFLGKGLTAWMGLRLLHRVARDETILVQGAASATGSILSSWAKALGVRVIGTTGVPTKRNTIARNADHALLTSDPEFASKIERIARGGVDVVYDFVGRATMAHSLASVRRGGSLVTIGAASGSAQVDEAAAAKDVRVAGGSMVRNVRGAELRTAIAELFEAVRDGIFASLEVTRYPLEAAMKAHEDIAARRLVGPAILVVS